MKQILDQIRALHTDVTSRTGHLPPQLSPLKALTEQLKRGSMGRTSSAVSSPPAAETTGSLSPELAGQVDSVLKELHSLNKKINSNLQVLQPYVTFLRTAQQVRVSSGVPLRGKLKMLLGSGSVAAAGDNPPPAS